MKGLSWTLSKNTAEWFAKRHLFGKKGYGYLFYGEIKRKDIIALFDCRNEREVVCDYRKVRNIQRETISDSEV